ncbi:ACT domain-containing protein [Blastococcus brunescens]|uniref:ACT domain-containing protein n=1 Tax=Blastococcus brunescens TaxID=1564165 RepID=A0ABZ1B507_9ACTN|nr:ACT domain-containing protein [Blastococcus sp. BMG 8361]WRL64105.1 ACT domain-containing protein [Blastococcus sp. BMG 8361]
MAVVGDRTGALLALLSEFAVRGISLTRIESRPTRERLGVYSFSLDCEGHVADARVGEALAALHRVCDDVRFLGSYARADGRENVPVPEVAADAAFAEAEDWLARIRGSRCS